MPRNGKSKELTKREISKLNKLLDNTTNFTGFLKDKGIDHQSLRRPLECGRISERLYGRLLAADLI